MDLHGAAVPPPPGLRRAVSDHSHHTVWHGLPEHDWHSGLPLEVAGPRRARRRAEEVEGGTRPADLAERRLLEDADVVRVHDESVFGHPGQHRDRPDHATR